MRVRLHMGVRHALLFVLFASPASAQKWHATAQAGRMSSTLDPAQAAATVAIGLRYGAPASAFGISAGVPTSSVESLWAGASAWHRAALRRSGLVAGIDLSGQAFVTRERHERAPVTGTPPVIPPPFGQPLDPEIADMSGRALTGQAMPLIGWEGLRLHVHVRAGVSHYAAKFGDASTDRTVRLADAQLTFMPALSFAIMPVARWYDTADEGAATFAGVSAVFAHELGSVHAGSGVWIRPDEAGTPWFAGATLHLHPRVALEASARRDVIDPLYLQPPQTSWSVGLAVQVGGPAGAPAPPVPAQYVDGRATITLPVSESAEPPSIAGDFNDWKPAPMQRDGDRWVYTVAVRPGVYSYSFVARDGTWFVPRNVPGRRDDGMGGHVAVLIVE